MSLEDWQTTQQARIDIVKARNPNRRQVDYMGSPVSPSETQIAIKSFSSETQKALEKQGFVICVLTEKSVQTLRSAGIKIQSTQYDNYPALKTLQSMAMEVAIKPNLLFLPKSNRKPFTQQQEMVTAYSEELSKQVTGVKAIIGEAPDYVELAFQYLDKGVYLFGSKYNFAYTRTRTKTISPFAVIVGNHSVADGLEVRDWHVQHSDDSVWIAPLVVPNKI